jgi:hypothetical protein
MSPLAAAAAAFRSREADIRSRQFPVAARQLTVQRQKDLLKAKERRDGKKLIRPENADAIIDNLPADESETLHAITCGDFVFCDLITRLVERHGPPRKLTVCSLSISLKNCEAIAAMMAAHADLTFHLVLSHYFQTTNKDIFIALEKLVAETFHDRCVVTVGRSHAKITVFEYEQPIIIETSANLRSSNNLEQIIVTRGRDLADFHLAWIEELRALNAPEKS